MRTEKKDHQPGQKGAPATWRWQPLLFRLVLPNGQKGAFCPDCQTPLLSRPGVPGWKTGTKRVSQPGQIKVSVVV